MIVMLDTRVSLSLCSYQLRCPTGQLLTPLTRYRLQSEAPFFAVDNGCFHSFNPKRFTNLLKRHERLKCCCRFVVVPDQVGNSSATLSLWSQWQPLLHDWPLAFVAQDGQAAATVPWDQIRCLFIGGTDSFKLGPGAAALIAMAHSLGKWVHMGRVNSVRRFLYAQSLGVTSIDGSGLARFENMRLRIGRRPLTNLT
jgi:hypothetical protein